MVRPVRTHAESRAGTAALCGALLCLPLAIAACSGGTAGDPNNRGPFKLLLASTGLGQIFPYRIRELDAFRVPSEKVVNISSPADLKKNVTATNGIVPPATWLTTATLPGGATGNHFLMMRFSHVLNVTSVLSATSTANSGLTGSIQVLAYDPATEVQSFVEGRAFIGGVTFFDDPTTPELDLKPVKAVGADGNGNVQILDARANGFPRGFTGDEDLVAKNTFVFVPDTDKNLATAETFPTGKVIRILATSSVRDFRDKPLVEEVCTGTTVGTDTTAPNVLGFSGNNLQISPGNGQLGVDPKTMIQVNFSKPVQPFEVGDFFNPSNLTPPLRGVTLNVTIASRTIPVLYWADSRSASDFCTFTLRPAFFFPGQVNVAVSINNTIHGIQGTLLGQTVTTTFRTGKGPGLVNAPVAPEAIYVGRGGTNAGLSVIDLNGFGQGTGDIGDTFPTHFIFNPNLGRPGVAPSLAPGTTNMDAGGEGALTLTRDTNLSPLLLDESSVSGVDDIQIGQPLDKIFNNENINPNATRANQTNGLTVALQVGNTISIAPHPNPPRLVFPPPNPAMQIFGEEPTQTSSTGPQPPPPVLVAVPPCAPSPSNVLVRGDPLTKDRNKAGIYGGVVQGVFNGPQPPPGSPQPPTPFCPYTSRQQIGHFLYVLDRSKKQVLIVNSNRMTVLETIRLSDPFSMALSPNLKRLAVSNFGADTVTFIDTDPQSQTFNQVVSETKVGRGPSGLAWQPEGEDLLVVNSLGNSLTIIGGADLRPRKTVIGLLNEPIDVAVTPRQQTFGFQTGIYFAYILNSNGTVAVFESGPDGVNGIGFDDVIGIPEGLSFRGARTLQPSITSFNSAIWIGHTDSAGLGQVSHMELTSSPTGPQPIISNVGGFILPPTFRQREWTVSGRLGGSSPSTPIKDRFSGNSPVDIAVDEIFNFGGLADLTSNQISNLTYADHSGKGMIKGGGIGVQPRFIFVALADAGTVDVVEIDTGKVVRRIDVPGVRSLANYWRQ